MDKWIEDVFTSESNRSSPALVANVLWILWQRRDQVVFQNKPLKLDSIVEEAVAEVQKFMNFSSYSGQWKTRKKPISLPAKWSPLSPGSWRFTVDCSMIEGDNEGSVAGLCRDSTGRISGGFAEKKRARSGVELETLALTTAVRMLSEVLREEVLVVSHVELCSDCSPAVSILAKKEESPWAIQDEVVTCRELLAQFPNVHLVHIDRELNRISDWMAKAHRRNELPLNWISNLPYPLLDLLSEESVMLRTCIADSE